jgi:hypothetical protein
MRFKPIARKEFTGVKFKRSGFKIEIDNFVIIAFLDSRSHLRLIDGVAASGQFFFAVTGFPDYHRLNLMPDLPFYLNLGDRSFCSKDFSLY